MGQTKAEKHMRQDESQVIVRLKTRKIALGKQGNLLKSGLFR